MKTVIALLLLAASAWGAEPAAVQPAPPPKPPHVWHVWGCKWDGSQWVKQDDHCLATSDLQQAADYLNAIISHHGWSVAHDLPYPCITLITYDDSDYPQVTIEVPTPSFWVWAFKLIDGKWVKQKAYCHEFRVDDRVWQYQASVNAVPGWRATSDLPPAIPEERQKHYMHQPVVDFPYPHWYSTGANGEELFNWNDGTVRYYSHHYHHH
jgi:hypothetical protein